MKRRGQFSDGVMPSRIGGGAGGSAPLPRFSCPLLCLHSATCNVSLEVHVKHATGWVRAGSGALQQQGRVASTERRRSNHVFEPRGSVISKGLVTPCRCRFLSSSPASWRIPQPRGPPSRQSLGRQWGRGHCQGAKQPGLHLPRVQAGPPPQQVHPPFTSNGSVCLPKHHSVSRQRTHGLGSQAVVVVLRQHVVPARDGPQQVDQRNHGAQESTACAAAAVVSLHKKTP